jgi:DNA-binding IclR family transcriptional regulator
VTAWWENPDLGGIPTQGGGRVTTRLEITISIPAKCTGCGRTWIAATHTERDPEHVPNETTATQFQANSAALVHAGNCTARPKEQQ